MIALIVKTLTLMMEILMILMYHHLIGVLNQTLALRESGSEPGVHIFLSDICSIKSRACSVTMDFALFMALYTLVVAFVTSMSLWCCCGMAAKRKSKSQGFVLNSKGSVESKGSDFVLSPFIITENGKKYHSTFHCKHVEDKTYFGAYWCSKCIRQSNSDDYYLFSFPRIIFGCRAGDKYVFHFDRNCDFVSKHSSQLDMCKTCLKKMLVEAGPDRLLYFQNPKLDWALTEESLLKSDWLLLPPE